MLPITCGDSKVVYLCKFEGSLECIYMGILGLFWFWGWVWISRQDDRRRIILISPLWKI